MKYDFATVQVGGFTAPGLTLARWIEFFSTTDFGINLIRQWKVGSLAG
jgi:hypothetical protein